ncbi:MAG: hypothetical protein ABR969_00810 [Sedimentisphaerales bacterium]|jgi:hypothetical protein
MQNQEETTKINHFLSAILPIVIRSVKTFLQSTGLEVEEKGNGPDTVFHIKAGEKEADFYLYNLLMEIATVDRDEQPWRFDENLQDFDYFLNKVAKVIESKLRILFKLLEHDDVDKAMESITELAGSYERIRIIKLDKQQS